MNIKSVFKLSIVPMILICLGVFSYFAQVKMSSTHYENASQEKLSELINQVQSGSIQLGKNQVISILKAENDADISSRDEVEAANELIRQLSLLIIALGLMQIGIVFIMYKQGKTGINNSHSV